MKNNQKTAICIASGPSLTEPDVNYVRGKGTVYVTNEIGLHYAPWADVLYAADTDWWEKHIQQAKNVFEGEMWTCSHRASELYDLNYVEAKSHWHWSTTPGAVATGGNSGFQIANLAALHGAERIILLGYDMGYDHNEQKHCFDKDHPPKIVRPSNYTEWVKRFRRAQPHIDVEIINASIKTKLNCFPQQKLRDVI